MTAMCKPTAHRRARSGIGARSLWLALGMGIIATAVAVRSGPNSLASDSVQVEVEVPRPDQDGAFKPEWLGFVANDGQLIARYSIGESAGVIAAWDAATLARKVQWN